MPLQAVYPNSEPHAGAETVTRSTDAATLSFPLPLVMAIVGTALSMSGAQYVFQSGQRTSQAEIQSDIRDMKTRMEMQDRVDQAEQKARTIEMQAQAEAIADLRRLTQLLQIQYQELTAKGK